MTKNISYLSDLDDSQRKKKNELFAKEVRPLNLTESMSIADMVENMQGMSIQARNIGRCAKVLKSMYADSGRPTVMLGLAGPLIAAGLRNTICDLVKAGAIDVIVSTGAILYQDIYQARGYRHYQGTPDADDTMLRDLWIDRIYDTYVDEEKFWETDMWCGHLADDMPEGPCSSRQYLDFAGKHLDDEDSIVFQCARRGIPMFAPAINDSSIGIGLTEHYHRHKTLGTKLTHISSIQDNYELTQIVVQSGKTAAFYVAGGVPKNYINDSIVMGYIFDKNQGHEYALQITADNPHWGGLSGSTLEEAQSWGKIKKEATTAMALIEPSVSFPLLAAYILQRKLADGRPPLKLEWEGDILKSLSF